jgi:uncharacterized protein YcbX
VATLSELYIYPFKSARAIPLRSARLGATGLQWDRHWMAVDERSRFVSQRTHPLLARVQPALDFDAGNLRLEAQGMPPLFLRLDAGGQETSVALWDDCCAALDQGDAAARWISQVAGAALRVVRMAPETRRIASPRYVGSNAAKVSFADAFPLLVCNRASLDELNERMPEPVPMERFRPNIVLEGLPAFAEDGIRAVRIGATSLRLVKPSTRCIITSTDQKSGARATDPLPVLRKFRFDAALKGVTFGVNAVIDAGEGQELGRGAACEVVAAHSVRGS